MTLTEVDNQACFCGGLVEYSKMLSSVESLLCYSPHHSSSMLSSSQGHVSKEQKTRQGMAIPIDLIPKDLYVIFKSGPRFQGAENPSRNGYPNRPHPKRPPHKRPPLKRPYPKRPHPKRPHHKRPHHKRPHHKRPHRLLGRQS